MKLKTVMTGLAAAAMGMAFAGCSFSASASAGNKKSLVGKEKIVVSADQPPPKVDAQSVKRLAKIVGKKIEISEKVMFDTAKATIKSESHKLLNDVADIMKENPSIEKIRIEGHTDSDGKDKYNKKLSKDRAAAVMAFLVEAGVEASRMESKGYGEDKPIASNDTEEGKYQNRRVEFNIIKQTKK